MQEGTTAETEVPVEHTDAIRDSTLRLSLIELATREVEDIHHHIHLCASHALGNDKRGLIPGRILRTDHIHVAR